MNTRTTTQAFFDPKTWTVSYVVADSATRHAAIIDPVLDYDFKSGQTSTASADLVLAYLKQHDLQVDWIRGRLAAPDCLQTPCLGRARHRCHEPSAAAYLLPLPGIQSGRSG